MKKFAVDYNSLDNKINKKVYKLSEVQDKIVKVAWDVCKFKDTDTAAAGLWEINHAEDGQDYIVAMYDDEEEVEKKSNWQVDLNKTANYVQISYKGDPLVKMACSKLGIPTNEIDKVKEYLPNKLASNKKLVKALLTEVSSSIKESILNKYPELV